MRKGTEKYHGYYAVLAARIGGEEIEVEKFGPFRSMYDPNLVREAEERFPPDAWNIIEVLRLHPKDFSKVWTRWKRTCTYKASRRSYLPEPGRAYRSLNNKLYRCVRFNHERGAAVLQDERGWTFTAYRVSIYSDGRIDWDCLKDDDHPFDGHYEEA